MNAPTTEKVIGWPQTVNDPKFHKDLVALATQFG